MTEQDRLAELSARFLAGALSADEEAELSRLLAADPESAAEFRRQAALDALLRTRAGRIPAREDLQERVERSIEGPPRRRHGTGGRRSAWIPATVAAGILAGVTLLLAWPRPGPKPRESAASPDRRKADLERREREAREEIARIEEERRRERERVEALERERRKLLDGQRLAEAAEKARAQEEARRALERMEEARKEAQARLEKTQAERRQVEPPPANAPKAETVPALATLERAEGECFLHAAGARRPARAGDALREGEGLSTGGPGSLAVVGYGDGTRLELGPGTSVAEFSDRAGKRVALSRGSVVARVAKQAPDRAMIFATPQGEANVVGTTLRIVADAASTWLDVTEGNVRLTRPDGKWVEVAGGHAAVAAAGLELVSKRLAAPPSALGMAAARMRPGSWVDLETEGFNRGEVLAPGGPFDTVTRSAESACWNPRTRQLVFQGSSRGKLLTLITYSEDSNAWQAAPTHPALAANMASQAGDQNALDAATGDLYYRPSYSDTVYRYRIQERAWSTLPPVPGDLWRAQSTDDGALEHFPEMGGLVLVGGNQPEGGGSVAFFNLRSGRWRLLARGLAMGTNRTFIEYSPVHRLVLFGGGDGSTDLYRLDAAGRVAKAKSAPMPLGVGRTVVSVDPAGGRHLVLHPAGFHEYDPVADAWTPILGERPPVLSAGGGVGDGLIETAIPAHGVVMYVKYAGADSKVFLYKHLATPKK